MGKRARSVAEFFEEVPGKLVFLAATGAVGSMAYAWSHDGKTPELWSRESLLIVVALALLIAKWWPNRHTKAEASGQLSIDWAPLRDAANQVINTVGHGLKGVERFDLNIESALELVKSPDGSAMFAVL